MKFTTVTVETFWAKIYVGFFDTKTKKNVGSLRRTRELCQEYVDSVSLYVTVTPTEYIYVYGREKGVEIGLINYPRFASSKSQIKTLALDLAEKLMIAFRQNKVSVVMPTETIMLYG